MHGYELMQDDIVEMWYQKILKKFNLFGKVIKKQSSVLAIVTHSWKIAIF